MDYTFKTNTLNLNYKEYYEIILMTSENAFREIEKNIGFLVDDTVILNVR